LPALAPTLREVGVHLDWLGPLTPAAHLFSPLTGLAGRLPGAVGAAQSLAAAVGRRVGEAPSAATVERARTVTVAEVRDAAGARAARVELAGTEPYGFTAAMLA